MMKKYLPGLLSIFFYAAAIIGINLLLIFIYGVAMGIIHGVDIFDAPSYFRTAANLLFLEGALVFTFGAFVEFFIRARSPSIARSMMLPYEVLSRRFALAEKDRDAALMGDTGSGGWILIFIGALVVIFSTVFALISLK
jgi:hypothetical protein